MESIFKKWNYFLSKQKEKIITKSELLKLLRDDEIDTPRINIDTPRTQEKKFGGLKKVKLKFDYGEWPDLINSSDSMGWDLIIVPSSDKNTPNLKPAGEINYKTDKNTWDDIGKEMPKGMAGNTKIILAPDGVAKEEDKIIINDFFSKLIQFKKVVWFERTGD